MSNGRLPHLGNIAYFCIRIVPRLKRARLTRLRIGHLGYHLKGKLGQSLVHKNENEAITSNQKS